MPFAPATTYAEHGVGGKTMPILVSPTNTTRTAKRQAGSKGGELLVRFRQGTSDSDADTLILSFGLKREGRLRGASAAERLTLPPGQSAEAVLPGLLSNPSVEFAEPNFVITADQAEPNDPRFDEQWALGGQRGRAAGGGVKAAPAWSRTTGSESTVIAIIDSGVDFTHPDLRDNVWTNPKAGSGNGAAGDGYAGDRHGWDWVSDAPGAGDESGHGTRVAGLIAAVGNNGEGVAGVMWRASLMSLRVLDSENKGTVAGAVEAIDYAVANGARVINCSWGLGEPSVALRQAIARAVSGGVTVVSSAGNGAQDLEAAPRFPSSYGLPYVLSVSATGPEDELTAASNWGAERVALAAPGENLLTTKAGGGYELFSGTSAAAAVVSGVAGLVKTLRPRLGVERTQELILRGVRKVPALDGKVMSRGVADAAAALEAVTILRPGEGLNEGDSEEGEGANGARGRDASAAPAPPSQAAARITHAPAAGLPDLNEERRRPRGEVRAIPPVPSTRRRCPPNNPRCNEEPDGNVRPTPMPNRRAATGGPGISAGIQSAALSVWSLMRLAGGSLVSGPRATSAPPLYHPDDARAPEPRATAPVSTAGFGPGHLATAASLGDPSNMIARLTNNYSSLLAWSSRREGGIAVSVPALEYYRSAAFSVTDAPGVGDAAGGLRSAARSRVPLGAAGGAAMLAPTMLIQSGGNPYGGTAAAVPGTVEIERFDEGGQGVGYNDTTAGSHGQDYDQSGSPVPSFRQPTDVDIYKSSSVYSGGYLIVGQAGEWLNYTVDIATTGTYTLSARVAWGGTAGGNFRVEVDGIDKTGSVQIPDTAWEMQTISKPGVQLPAGRHTLRVVWETNSASGYTGDIDNLGFTLTAAAGGQAQPVVWQNAVGVSVSGNSLTKTAAEGWNAGASSAQSIPSGDCSVEFTASNLSARMVGLSNGDAHQSHVDIDFALYPNAVGMVEIWEAGTFKWGGSISYVAGDRFRVAVEGGAVKYYKFSGGAPVHLYTSGIAPTYPLLVDTSLYYTGAQIGDAVITGPPASGSPTWQNLVGVSAGSGGDLTKTGTVVGWNAGASSVQTLAAGNGSVEFTAGAINNYRMLGLSNGDSNQDYSDIDFAIYPTADGPLYVYESGVQKAHVGGYATGDRLKVAVEGGAVKYYRNGTLLYTSTAAPTYPLRVDTSLYTPGGTIQSVTFNGTTPLAPVAGLAGHWKFDEGAGPAAADSSGNNITGSLQGPSWAGGQSGSAVRFDGVNDYVGMGSSPSLAAGSSFTVSAWIRPAGPGSLATYGGIIVNKEGEYEIARFTDGTIQWAVANAGPGWNWVNTGAVAPLNQWTHVTFAYDGAAAKTYINGTLAHTQAVSGAIGDVDASQNEFRVGGRQCCSQYFHGDIDEVRFYSRALAAGEAAEVPGGASAAGYNAVTDFSATQNPAGPWGYGYKPQGGSFTLLTGTSTFFGAGTNTWALPGQACCPMVTKNKTGAAYTYPTAASVLHPPDVLNLHPGPAGERGVLRWTAPSPGTYTITGRFQGIDNAGTTSDALVAHNGAALFSGAVNGYGAQLPFSLTRTVAAGDQIEFSVGVGSNGNYNNDSTGVAVTISPPVTAGTGLWARYYDNMDFSAYRVGRVDPKVDFEWNHGTPDPSVGPDQFSARWTGMIVPRYTETYTFHTQSDDGVRLWVGGALVINNWTDHAWTTDTGTITLSAGAATPIRMEFYENVGGAIAKLEWSSASQAREIIPQSQLNCCWKDSRAYVRDFYQGALHRQPTAPELQEWAARLTQAQGADQLRNAVASLGQAIFSSPEYLAHNPSDNGHFVSDIYQGYLQRPADTGGLGGWTSYANSNGRAATLAAFEQSAELNNKIQLLCDAAAAIGGGDNGYDFSTARLDPSNRTGGQGADPLSRNFNWSTPLVGLPGRAGLDLGLGLSYNSLVWTRDANGIAFDADRGWPSPGFRLGFPTIQPKFYNPRTNKYAYLLLTPSGARSELRQIGTTSVYESADSTYTQLNEGGGTLTLLTTDGTRLSFTLVNGEYRCDGVKDRNGNYLSVAYHADGRLDRVTDTLGRVVTFNYDSYQNLLTITQPWKRETDTGAFVDETHVWASFGYTNLTLQPAFTNLAVVGEQYGTVIPVVSQVGLGDGSYYKFAYNQWGQVWKATHFAADSNPATDNHPLSHVRLNLPGSDLAGATPQADCPRFTEMREWVEHGVMNQSAEVTTGYSPWVYNMAACDVTLPDPTPSDAGDNVVLKDIYATTGWQRGLTTQSEVRAGGVLRKWTTLVWTQDDLGVGFRINPRVAESTVHDSEGNHRRTTISYTQFGLPEDVTEYQANTTTPLRTMRTAYNLAGEYTSRRLIGLPSFQYVYEGLPAAANLRQKIGFVYDDNTLPDYLKALPTAATQHDGAGYGTGLRWRGNLSRVVRYQLNTQTWAETGATTETKTGYNITGTAAFTKDALDRQVTVSHADSFDQGLNRSSPSLPTYAYPTSVTVTDPGAITSSQRYNYDTASPTLTTDPKNALVKMIYDAAGRRQRATRIDGTSGLGKGYTRWEYPASMGLVQSFTLTKTTGQDEAYSAELLDGAGRVRATASDHPNSVGGYAAQFFNFDALGRLVDTSNPTETNGSAGNWQATGDDNPAAPTNGPGWVYTHQAYDWKGRPTTTTNDADTTSRTLSYGGCGCAGGEIVTQTDERGHKQRTTSDVLGRPTVVEDLHANDTVYRKATTTYDVLNRVTQLAERAEPSGVTQFTTTEYDGYGRVWKTKTPQATGQVTFTYYADDSTFERIDVGGGKATYTYNNRGMVNSIAYTPTANVSNVSFGYDAAGNRISMTDGLGSATYVYDTLSRMTSETRHFGGLNQSFTTTYDYSHSDQLTRVTDHYGVTVNYTRDRTGRLTDMPGYATDIKYRAWGAVKEQALGNGRSVQLGYNGRMRATLFNVPGITGWTYNYTADGRLQFAHNLQTAGTRDERLDRKLEYDHFGRLSSGLSGSQARGEATSPSTGIYRQGFNHDAFDHLTFRDSQRGSVYGSYSASYTNNRNTNLGWEYFDNGLLKKTTEGSSTSHYSYNAALELISTSMITSTTSRTVSFGYDGDGQRAKRNEAGADTYFVRSTPLGGQVLDEVGSNGAKLRGYVYQEGRLIAKHEGAQTQWDVRDPANFSNYVLNSTGGMASFVQLDPLGTVVDPNAPSQTTNPTGFYGGPSLQGTYCRVNNLGISVPCSLAAMLNGSNFGLTVSVGNNTGMSMAMVQGLIDIGRINPSDVVFGNPWDLRNMTFTMGLDPHDQRTYSNGGMAEEYGYFWMSGWGSSTSREGGRSSPGAFVRLAHAPAQYDPRADFTNYARQLLSDPNRDDCEALARLIYKAGQVWSGNGGADAIMTGLLQGLTERTSMLPRGDPSDPNFRVGVDPPGPQFGQNGFRKEFQDNESPNQVRHAVAYLVLGYRSPLLAASDSIAWGRDISNQPDKDLGYAANRLGSRFKGDYKKLARDFYDQICERGKYFNLQL